MSDLVGNPEDRFSHNEAHLSTGDISPAPGDSHEEQRTWSMCSCPRVGAHELPLYRRYCKVPKFLDARNFAVIHLKFKQRGET